MTTSRGRGLSAIILAVVLAGASACSDDDPPASIASVTPGGPEIIATYGAASLSNATPGVTPDFVLESLKCEDGVLTMATSSGVFTGAMDCAAMPPPLAIAGFGNKPLAITVSNSRLKIEAAGAGTLDMPVAGATLERP